MSDLVRRSGGLGGDRRVGRELARLDADARLSIAHVEQEANVQTARVHGLGYVGKQALHEAAILSETEQQLCRLVPEAAGRLTAIADMTALGLAEIVTETAHRLGRS
jgi:hypothetical protein